MSIATIRGGKKVSEGGYSSIQKTTKYSKGQIVLFGNIDFWQIDLKQQKQFLETECLNYATVTLDLTEAVPCDSTIFSAIISFLSFAQSHGKEAVIIDRPDSIVQRYLKQIAEKTFGKCDYKLILI
ncbi:MAG: hypothetical protein WCW17_00690 [Patescibacteria group bacterium]|jgi:ABC-type transporter Mla MlaB component